MKIGIFSTNGKEKGDAILILDKKENNTLFDMIEFAAKHKDNKRKKTWKAFYDRLFADLPY